MLSFLQDIPIVLAAIVGSLASWWLVRRLWPPERRRVHNEITGWQISVLGTTYAVIIGFMLFAAWSDFRAADQNAMAEASCLINLYWTSSGLPAGQRDAIRKLSADYADAMIADEWPAMNRGVVSPTGTHIVQQLWATVSEAQSLTASQQVSLEHTMTELGDITEHRRIRQLQSESRLPGILWTVLIVGAFLTILSSCLFGSEYPVLHLMQVVTLALLLSLALAAIADINHPFQGTVHVSPKGFENAKRVFEKYP
ncbi:MAG TPA: DUF4239 domain-containing protein [Terriglobales bacterium]